jgi:hypothetical protein
MINSPAIHQYDITDSGPGDFAAGFAAGEAQSFADRRAGTHTLRRPGAILNRWALGFWSGYMPRRPGWAHTPQDDEPSGFDLAQP